MSGARDILASIDPKHRERYRLQIEAQLAPRRSIHPLAAPAPQSVVTEAAPGERRIRQSHKPRLNKLEEEFGAILRVEHPDVRIYDQAFRVELANGQWYKVDFWVPKRSLAFEVKGKKSFRGGFENLKSAASTYPDITWVLVWKDEGRWYRQTMVP